MTTLEIILAITSIVSTLAACASAIFALWSISSSKKVAKEQMMVEIQLKTQETFDSLALVVARGKLAAQFLDEIVNNASSAARHDIIKEDVMNFFEMVGMFLRRGYLDEEMTWSSFGYHIIRWWGACEAYIKEERVLKNDSTLFIEFENLLDKMYEVEIKERHESMQKIIPSKTEIKEFLEEELGYKFQGAQIIKK